MLAFSATFLCTGCDLVRASLGKPTSADLELLRLAERVRSESAAKDTLALSSAEVAAPAPAETEASAAPVVPEEVSPALDSAPQPVPVKAPAAGGIKKYYAVVGAFKEEPGLRKYVNSMEEKGFRVTLLDFKSGSTAVCSEGADDIETARAQMKALKEAGFDPWLYNSNQKLHKEQ